VLLLLLLLLLLPGRWGMRSRHGPLLLGLGRRGLLGRLVTSHLLSQHRVVLLCGLEALLHGMEALLTCLQLRLHCC
jgi:hypothetical protein